MVSGFKNNYIFYDEFHFSFLADERIGL